MDLDLLFGGFEPSHPSQPPTITTDSLGRVGTRKISKKVRMAWPFNEFCHTRS